MRLSVAKDLIRLHAQRTEFDGDPDLEAAFRSQPMILSRGTRFQKQPESIIDRSLARSPAERATTRGNRNESPLLAVAMDFFP